MLLNAGDDCAVVSHSLQNHGAGVVRVKPRLEFTGVIGVVVVGPRVGKLAVVVGTRGVIAGTGTGAEVADDELVGVEERGTGRTLFCASAVGVGVPVDTPVFVAVGE